MENLATGNIAQAAGHFFDVEENTLLTYSQRTIFFFFLIPSNVFLEIAVSVLISRTYPHVFVKFFPTNAAQRISFVGQHINGINLVIFEGLTSLIFF